MDRAGPPVRGAIRRRPRRLDRQRGAADHRQRPRLLPGRPLLGRQRLRPHLRRLPAARRADGGPARAPAGVHRRPDPLRDRLVRGRARELAGRPGRGPRRAGPRRRDPLAGGALDRHHHVPGRCRAQQGARRLGRGRGLRRRGRRAARRRAHRSTRAGSGCSGSTCRSASGPRYLAPRLLAESRSESKTRAFDFAGAATVTAGLSVLVYALVEAPNAGWGSAQTIGLLAAAVVLLAAFVADRATVRRAAGAVLDLPPADAHRRQRGRAAHRRLPVLDVLLHLAVHAERARLQRDQGRALVPAPGGDDHHRRRGRLAARHPRSASSRCSRSGCS